MKASIGASGLAGQGRPRKWFGQASAALVVLLAGCTGVPTNSPQMPLAPTAPTVTSANPQTSPSPAEEITDWDGFNAEEVIDPNGWLTVGSMVEALKDGSDGAFVSYLALATEASWNESSGLQLTIDKVERKTHIDQSLPWTNGEVRPETIHISQPLILIDANSYRPMDPMLFARFVDRFANRAFQVTVINESITVLQEIYVP